MSRSPISNTFKTIIFFILSIVIMDSFIFFFFFKDSLDYEKFHKALKMEKIYLDKIDILEKRLNASKTFTEHFGNNCLNLSSKDEHILMNNESLKHASINPMDISSRTKRHTRLPSSSVYCFNSTTFGRFLNVSLNQDYVNFKIYIIIHSIKNSL